MPGLKDFFAAGLAMEAAREAREVARNRLRDAAAVHCPEELAALNRASDAVRAAEQSFAQAMESVATQQRDAAHQQLHACGIDCGDTKCPIKTASENGFGRN